MKSSIEKLITRKNLLIVNIVLAVVFMLLTLKLVWAFTGGGDRQIVQAGDIGADTVKKLKAKQAERTAYNIITENDLFVSKRKAEVRPVASKRHYDLTKVWKLEGMMYYPDGLHALIRDRAEPDRPARKSYTIYEVWEGKILEGTQKARIYKVEILEVTKDYVTYYRHDMEDETEDARTFVLKLW